MTRDKVTRCGDITRQILPRIAECEAQLFDQPLTLAALETLFEGPAFTGCVCVDNRGILVAYVVAHRTPDEIEILSLGTVAQAQRQGYASRVLAALLEKAGRARIVLEVAADNEAAIRLYKGHGFCERGRRPNYYRREGNACDAVMMHYP